MDGYAPRVALDIRRRWTPSVTCGLDRLTGRLYKMHIAYLAAETGDIRAEDLLLADLLGSPWIDPSFERAKLLGKALAYEIKDRRGFEDKVLRLIGNKELDDYDRLALHYLFLNYVGFLPNAGERDRKMNRLEKADATIPDYLSVTVNE